MLEAHRDLKELVIENYGGTKFPKWVADSSSQNLLSLDLNNCKNCKLLPPIGKLPLLKDLFIRGMHDLNKIGIEFYGENQSNAFPSLERLCFEDMPQWKEWDLNEVDEQVAKFPRLREFCIRNCPQLLGRFPDTLYSLETLVIRGYAQLVVSISNLPRLTQLGSVGHLRSLRDVKILNFPELVSLEPEDFEEEQLQLGNVCNIESLTICCCKRLKRIPPALHFLATLTEMRIKRLVIDGCVNLQLQILIISSCLNLSSLSSSGKLPVRLKQLFIRNCLKLESIVQTIHEKSCLEYLHIFGCRNVKSLPRGLNKLNHLQTIEIWQCASLVSLTESGLPTTNLVLCIGDCPLLGALPDYQNLTALKELRLHDCSPHMSFAEEGFLTSLTSLSISAPKLCSSLLKWVLHILTSLKYLFINGKECPDVVTFPQEGRGIMLPSSLTKITIERFENLSNLSTKGFRNLTSLQEFWILECSNLETLPENDVLLCLGKLYIWRCGPSLTGQCISNQGPEWSKISHIPRVVANHQNIIPKTRWFNLP
ncbi:hypothetical protein PTKIN_Ptkin14bG0197300 [Pterospermum kingtungense]